MKPAELQERYLGLGAEIQIAAQMRSMYEDALLDPDSFHPIPNLESLIAEQAKKIMALHRQRLALELLMGSSGIPLPDEYTWRRPEPPPNLQADLALRKERLANTPPPRTEMHHTEPVEKKSARKKAQIKPRVAKIKKEK